MNEWGIMLRGSKATTTILIAVMMSWEKPVLLQARNASTGTGGMDVPPLALAPTNRRIRTRSRGCFMLPQ